MNAAYAANEREGAEIAARHGGVDDYDWMYYNSDYYYKEEDVRNRSVRPGWELTTNCTERSLSMPSLFS